MNKQSKKQNGSRQSLIIGAVDKLGNLIRRALAKSRIGKAIASNDKLYKESKLSVIENKMRSSRRKAVYTDLVEHSRVLRAIGSFSSFLASISFNVYGIFMIVYGIVSVIMYYVSIALNGRYSNGEYAFILPVIMILCGIPMLVSSSSVAQVISKSRIMRRVSLSFLGLSEEKLRIKGAIGGIEITFFASIFAILFGIFTYFLHPAYFPALFGVVVISCLIGVNPETGVILTVTAVPFLQYTRFSTEILCLFILLTLVSYIFKRAKRRRTGRVGSETVFLIIFCCFILVGCVFSAGGVEAFRKALIAVVVTIGGFYLTYNLMRTEKRLDVCIKTLVVSFVIICLSGIWNLLYNGFAEGIFYSIRDTVAPILENDLIYIADSATVFSVVSVAIFPLLLLQLTKQRTVKGKALVVTSVALVVITTFVYGTFEAIIALALEFILFFAIFSRRSFVILILSSIAICSAVFVYPYIAATFELPSIKGIFEAILPLNDAESSARLSVAAAVREMLADGNLGGIGVGENAFVKSFAPYADVVTEGATNPGMLWLQIPCWSGVGGLICFVIIAILLIKNAIGHLVFSRQAHLKSNVLALLCSFAVLMIFGTVNCIWNDFRTLYLFWLCAGLLAGYIKMGYDKEAKLQAELGCSEDDAEIELRFYTNHAD